MRKISAIVGIALLVLLYLVTLFFAIFGSENFMAMLMVSVVCTIVIPIILHLIAVMSMMKRGGRLFDDPYARPQNTDPEIGMLKAENEKTESEKAENEKAENEKAENAKAAT